MGGPAINLKVQQSADELKAHYRACTCAVERRRTQVIWWLTEGKSRQEVMQLTAYANVSLIKIIKRYNALGLAGLKDRRHENPGAPTLLSDSEMLLLAQNIRKDYALGKVWNGRKVLSWVKEELGKEIHEQRAYEALTAVNFSLQAPRARHAKADPLAQEGFKKRPFLKSSKQLVRVMKS